MGFHEQAVDTHGHRGACQCRHKFPLAPGPIAESARQLHRMGRVEHHRAAGVAHDHQGPHVRDQVVIAKRRAPFAHHDVFVAGGAGLLHHPRHVPGRHELTLFDIHRPPLARHILYEVGLAAEKRRGL